MTKDVLVTVVGTQISEEQEDTIEILNVGNYYERNGKKYIKYDETQEETGEVISNLIKIGPEGIELTKKGSVGAQMIFRENEKVNSCYDTPYGTLMMGIYTNKILCHVEEELIEIKVNYEIELNGELLSNARVHIKVVPKNPDGIKLI